MRQSDAVAAWLMIALWLAVAGRGTAQPAAHDWPSYMGPNYDGADRSGVKLIDDMTKVRLVWESEERRIGFGKTSTAYPNVGKEFGDLLPAGAGSPIVAGNLLIMSYFNPSGEALDEEFPKRAKGGLKAEAMVKERFLVAADDVVIAIDCATGKTRWKQVFKEKGLNWGSGKRPPWAMTPAAADGRVFAAGATGFVYALDLATGKPLWTSDLGPKHQELEAAKAAAIKERRLCARAGRLYGWIVVSGNVVLAPDWGGGVVAFAAADGKRLWSRSGVVSGFNMPAPADVGGAPHFVAVNGNGVLRLLRRDDGRDAWTVDLKVLHLTQPVVTKDHILLFEPHATETDAGGGGGERGEKPEPGEKAEPGGKAKGVADYGLLAAWRYDEKGAKRDWILPEKHSHQLHLDHGPTRAVIARDGIVYFARWGGKAHPGHEAYAIEERTGKILGTSPDTGKGTIFLWGDRLVVNTDLYHRPRRANAEIWQMVGADPSNFKPLGAGWHVNGDKPVHVATGGYELPTLDCFADGYLFCRVMGGFRCYDLRAAQGR
jgi:outer membrane protein assembly factor BamB